VSRQYFFEAEHIEDMREPNNRFNVILVILYKLLKIRYSHTAAFDICIYVVHLNG
jgi:hypothetical protein